MQEMLLATAAAGVLSFAGGLYMYRKWVAGGACRIRKDLTGKVVIVTGANTGIGYITSEQLALQGAHVILACRTDSLGQDAANNINANLKATKGQVEFMKLDLADLQSVRSFVKNFEAKRVPLHILINNAGVMALPNKVLTKDGFEMQFGTNHLGHFLLTGLLLPHLREAGSKDPTSSPRVVNVSSKASERYQTGAVIDFENLQSEKEYTPWGAYRQSKLANVLFARELARREKQSGSRVTSYSLHPGAVLTDIMRNLPWYLQILGKIPGFPLLIPFKTPFQGAQTTLYCALADIGDQSGQYFADCVLKKNPNPLAYDDDLAKRLWEVSEKLVKHSTN